jgi:ABC-2 type transport system permease protein
MALIYGYLFPLLFLLAFWAIYRSDTPPLAFHMGQLLTVTVLGGACFGLPTTLVSERERGVWRRYRLTPTPTWVFVAVTLVTRYVLLVTAALLQFAVAFAIGMPAPAHPFGLFVAFTFAAIAFLGLGMVIGMLADSVPAVQALGQCIFLPMLMIGGVAVPLASLPRWAQHVSAFFPGRYAVEAQQACITGSGLTTAGFDLLALLLIGMAGSGAAVKMFRWDAGQRLAIRGKTWAMLALGMWIVVGVLAEIHGAVLDDTVEASAPTAAATAATVTAPAVALPAGPASWRSVTKQDIANVAFERLPPDSGLVSPIAGPDERPDPDAAAQLARIRERLADWAPARVADPVQRARNLLYVAAVPDVLRMERIERFVPALVFERLRQDIPKDELPGILFWIAMHPQAGDDAALYRLEPLGLPGVHGPSGAARGRVMLYALKLLGRVNGDIPS